MINSMREEIETMMSGHFVPYHKLCIMVVLVVSLLFSLILCNHKIYDGRIAVIDLDRSHYSAHLLERINASSYIEISEIVHVPINPEKLMAHDRNLGVLYIPKGLEENKTNGNRTMTLGYFADHSNIAQNAEVFQNLNVILAAEGAEISAPRLGSLGLNGDETQALLQPLAVANRYSFNPTSTWCNTIISGFVYFFSSIYLGLTVLMIAGRLHVTGLWRNVVFQRGPAALIARIVPYAFFYTAAITFATGLLLTFNDLRFAGNFFAYVPSIFMTAMSFGLIALLLTWNHPTPANGASFMTFIVPPGFIMGGVTIATAFFPTWVYWWSYTFPLTWQFRFFRDFALRGQSFTEMLPTYGAMLIYMSFWAMLVVIRYYRTQKQVENDKHVVEDDLEPTQQSA